MWNATQKYHKTPDIGDLNSIAQATRCQYIVAMLTAKYRRTGYNGQPSGKRIMSKRKERRQRLKTYQEVVSLTAQTDIEEGEVYLEKEGAPPTAEFAKFLTKSPTLPQLKKFRFQLLHEWLTHNILPCRVADIGGGKGLLAHLLGESHWTATVIDPIHQVLPERYKDLISNRTVRLNQGQTVHRRNLRFEQEMAQDYDLLVGMHAHGCNVQIMDACKQHDRRFVLLPCCIIDEPLSPPQRTHWLQFLCEYGRNAGFDIHPFVLNFKGQNIGLYGQPRVSPLPTDYTSEEDTATVAPTPGKSS